MRREVNKVQVERKAGESLWVFENRSIFFELNLDMKILGGWRNMDLSPTLREEDIQSVLEPFKFWDLKNRKIMKKINLIAKTVNGWTKNTYFGNVTVRVRMCSWNVQEITTADRQSKCERPESSMSLRFLLCVAKWSSNLRECQQNQMSETKKTFLPKRIIHSEGFNDREFSSFTKRCQYCHVSSILGELFFEISKQIIKKETALGKLLYSSPCYMILIPGFLAGTESRRKIPLTYLIEKFVTSYWFGECSPFPCW